MPINNFEFPGVTLNQVFETTAALGVPAMGVCVIGPHFNYTTEQLANSADYSQAAGLSATLQTSDQTIDMSDVKPVLSVTAGIFSYADLAGTVSADGALVFTSPVKSGRGYTAGGALAARGARLGDKIVISSGDTKVTSSISKISFVEGVGYASIQVLDTISLEADAAVTVSFCLEQDAVYEQGANTFEVTAAGAVSISGGLKAAMDIVTEDGTAVEGTLVGGTFSVSYRTKSNTYVNRRGTVSSFADLVNVLGPVNPSNPLAVAAYFAMMAGNVSVDFTAVADDSSESYVIALDNLSRYADIYSIVPATEDKDVILACAGYCTSVSTDEDSKIRRALWYGISVDADTEAPDAAEVLEYKRVTQNYRCVAVFADGIELNGEVVGNYAGAAAAAGTRAGQPVQRPISNLTYSFFTLRDGLNLTNTQLKDIASRGIWVIANNGNNVPCNMRQLTTAVANSLNQDEESMVANADNVALVLCHIGENLVGCSNISESLLSSLTLSISSALDGIMLRSGGDMIGPQLLSWELVSLYQDTVNLDRVYADITITPPRPFNKFAMTLRVI